MITLRRENERYADGRGEQAARRTFQEAAPFQPASGFGGLQLLDEFRLGPGGTTKGHEPPSSETLIYVVSGAVAYEDSLASSGVLQAGEFRCVRAARGARSSETNVSRRDAAHLFRIGLRGSDQFPPAAEQRRFSSADRRDRLCLIAAREPIAGALRVRADALVYSALLQVGQHIVHDLRSERRAWLHVVCGEVACEELRLSRGDGLGIAAQRSVSFTAHAASEVLLIDVR